jgi:regulator of replication initiation timing
MTNLTKQDIIAITDLAKEAQNLRNENEKLRLAVRNLRLQLMLTASNIDASTINQSKRSQARWGTLRLDSMELLRTTEGFK